MLDALFPKKKKRILISLVIEFKQPVYKLTFNSNQNILLS